MSAPVAPPDTEAPYRPNHPPRPPDPVTSPNRRRVNVKGIDVQALTTWLTSNIDDTLVTNKVLDAVRKEEFIEYDSLDAFLGTQKSIIRVVWGGLQRFVREEEDQRPAEATRQRGTRNIPNETHRDAARNSQRQGDFPHIDRHQDRRGNDAVAMNSKPENFEHPQQYTEESQEDRRDNHRRGRRRSTQHDDIDRGRPTAGGREDLERTERRTGGDGGLDDHQGDPYRGQRDRYFSDEDRYVGHRSSRLYDERERRGDRNRRRWRDREVSDEERERGYRRNRSKGLSDGEPDGRRRRGRGTDETERMSGRDRRRGRYKYISDDDREDEYRRRRDSDLSDAERTRGRRRSGHSRDRERKRNRGQRRGRRSRHSDEEREDDYLQRRNRYVSDSEKENERCHASESEAEEIERIEGRGRRRARERRGRDRHRGRYKDDVSEDDTEGEQPNIRGFTENDGDGGNRRSADGDATAENGDSNGKHPGHRRGEARDARREENDSNVDDDQKKQAVSVGKRAQVVADTRRGRDESGFNSDQDEDHRQNGIAGSAQERGHELSRRESRPYKDPSDDDWYNSRRRRRGSRSRRDREESRERRQRRRRRRRLDYEEEEDRDHRRRRRHHRRDSRSRSPNITLSEERERDRRREERRARRRRRERDRDEGRDRRRSRKRKFEDDRRSRGDSWNEDVELGKREDRDDYDDGRDYRRDRRKRRKYHRDSSVSDGDLSDDARQQTRRHRRGGHDKDRYERDVGEADRRSREVYRRREDGPTGDIGLDNSKDVGLPYHSSRRNRELELQDTKNDHQHAREAPRHLTGGGEDLPREGTVIEPSRETRPGRGEEKMLYGSARYRRDVGSPLQEKRAVRTGEVSTIDPKSNQDGVETRGGRITGRPHVTERLGKVELKNGLPMPDIIARDERRDNVEKDVSNMATEKVGQKDSLTRRESSSGVDKAKSKVSKASLGDLRSKALASMKRK